MNKKVSAVIVAAGNSTRFGSPKLLESIDGQTVIEKTVATFESSELINDIVVVPSENLMCELKPLEDKFSKVKSVVRGGEVRQQSVLNGLLALGECDFVAIHDGARPFISSELIANTVNAAMEYGHAACGVSVKDTIKKVSGGKIVATVDRADLVQVQTPQVFTYDIILDAHLAYKGSNFSDDVALLENMNQAVAIVKGCYKNFKITTPEDIDLARFFIDKMK